MTSPIAGSAPRYAWYGRVSTEDEQDPTLSFPRQLGNAENRVAESGGRIVAHNYDVESGTGTLAARGRGGVACFDIRIPRDGGLQDLLAAASSRSRAFDRRSREMGVSAASAARLPSDRGSSAPRRGFAHASRRTLRPRPRRECCSECVARGSRAA
jgi:hypothetical protein